MFGGFGDRKLSKNGSCDVVLVSVHVVWWAGVAQRFAGKFPIAEYSLLFIHFPASINLEQNRRLENVEK